MLITLDKMTVEKNIEVINQQLQYVYCLAGECCATDALWLKKELLSLPAKQQVVLEMKAIIKTDLIAVNALVTAHRKHQLSVFLPTKDAACAIFRITKFDTVFEKLSPKFFHQFVYV